jgi:hypothetical protein
MEEGFVVANIGSEALDVHLEAVSCLGSEGSEPIVNDFTELCFQEEVPWSFWCRGHWWLNVVVPISSLGLETLKEMMRPNTRMRQATIPMNLRLVL